MKSFYLKSLCLALLALVCGSTASFAQAHKVSGKVVDQSTGDPLVGVNVIIKNAQQGTTTGPGGKYALTVPENGDTLIFSFVGYNRQERAADGRSTINIELQPNVESLQDVVVVGYGTQKKRDVTGSISQIKPEAIHTISSSNPLDALQGRAAGVSVSISSEPGISPFINSHTNMTNENATSIHIRGLGSLNANNQPLIVVDGFPLMNANLNDIDPNNIKSIEVLKDASATAIYGSRGANGVIMITTNTGTAGQNNLNFSSYVGIQSPARLVKMIGREDFIKFINAGYQNQTGKPVYTDQSPAPPYNTDWQNAVFKDHSYTQNYSLSFEGGTEHTRYMLSGGMFSQNGLLPKSGFKRYNVRVNLDHDFQKWLTVGAHLHMNNAVTNINDGTPDNIFRFGWPTMPIKNPDGSWYYAANDTQHAAYVEGYWNPVADADAVTNQVSDNRTLGDAYAQFHFLKHFSFRTNVGADLSTDKVYYYKTVTINSVNKGSQAYSQQSTIINENELTYANKWNDHSLKINGVYSYQKYIYQDLSVDGSNFPTDITGANNIALATILNTPSSDKYSNKLVSWTSRINYSYKDKYLLTLTGRYDGSSRFGANNKWGFFPSVGLGWRIIQEGFMQHSNLFSNLKLRASYGITGNQEIGDYQSLPKLTQADYVNNNNLLLGFTEGIGNPDLKWERTAQVDVGLDLGLWNDRLTANADYFKRNTSDLLYNVPIPTTSGFSSMLENIGEVQNQGFEVAANGRILDGNLKWNLGGNITRYRNKLVSLYGGVDKVELGESQGLVRYLIVGQPVNGIWARKSGGIIKDQKEADALKSIQPFAEPGGEKYVDVNGDGAINQDDYVLIGTTDPDFFYGISTDVEYKNFRLDVFGQGATGIATNSTDYLIYGENQIQNRVYIPSQYAYDRMWSESNPNGTFPKPGAKEVYLSDRTNGGRKYFILKNIRLNYNLKPELTHSNWFKNIDIYVNLQNYLSFANFRGYNPENGSINYPLAKVFIIGINATL